MNETRKGTENGYCVLQFEKDKEYEVSDRLACTLIAKGWASKAGIEPPSENPDRDKAYRAYKDASRLRGDWIKDLNKEA